MKKLLFIGFLGLMTACSPGTSNTKEGADTLKAQVSAPSDYDPEAKLKELGIELSTPLAPVANYVNAVRTGRLTAISQLSVLKAELGDLRKVKRIVKVLGMVNCAPDFTDQPKVVNGYSDLMVAVFGERGKHARAAVGMGSLPNNIAIEVEMIVEVE